MGREWTWRRAAFATVMFIVLGLSWMPARARTQAAAPGSGVPGFLQPDRCYRFTFSVVGATNWKVLEVLDAGWIKAEVSSGPSSTEHEPTWINTMQLVTVREARCSG